MDSGQDLAFALLLVLFAIIGIAVGQNIDRSIEGAQVYKAVEVCGERKLKTLTSTSFSSLEFTCGDGATYNFAKEEQWK